MKNKINHHFQRNICLVCLKNGEGLSIQDPILAEKYYFTTQLNITGNDVLPETICEKCVARMTVAYDFRRLALTSHKQLMSTSINTKMDEEFKTGSEHFQNESVTGLDDDELKILIEEGFDPSTRNNYGTKLLSVTNEESSVVVFEQKSAVEYLNEDLFDDVKSYEDENFDEDLDDNNDPFSDLVIVNPNKKKKSTQNNNVETTKKPISKNINNFFNDDQVKDIKQEHSMRTRKKNIKMKKKLGSQFLDSDCENKTKKGKRTNRKTKTGKRDQRFDENVFCCTKCNSKFVSKQNLNRHLASHNGAKPFQCSSCGKAFTQNGSLKKHMLIHTGERPHKCQICQRGFTQSTTLQRHMRRHTGEKPYECTQCDQKFRQKHMLKAHCDRVHQNETQIRKYGCSICNRWFTSTFEANEHQKSHDDNNSDVLKCSQCEKTFSSKFSFHMHLKTHQELKSNFIQCEICEKYFTSGTLLNDHIQKDHISKAKEKLHCSVCTKTFLVKSHFIQHMVTHNQSRYSMLICNDCSMCFVSKHELDVHRETEHNETTQHDCNHCDLLFDNVSDFNIHNLNVHTSIEEETLSGYSKKFTTTKILDNHELLDQILIADI